MTMSDELKTFTITSQTASIDASWSVKREAFFIAKGLSKYTLCSLRTASRLCEC
jgi:hypothetical protein